MNKSQLIAMRTNIRLGKKLQNSYPEILDLYIAGNTRLDIARLLKISDKFEINERGAENSIGYALRGYSGRLFTPYCGMTDEDELNRLAKEHMVNAGFRLRDEKRGIHSLSRDELRHASRKGAISLGRVSWEDDEKDLAYNLSLDRGYYYTNGKHKGQPDYRIIAQELNKKKHYGKNVRTPLAVRRMADKVKKTKK